MNDQVTSAAIRELSASRQLTFHTQLVAARKKLLSDALAAALLRVDPNVLRQQLSAYVPSDVQRTLAAAGIRDERVFPTPAILEAKPALIGYYRLLLGLPQKQFYGAGSGMGRFKRMEEQDVMTDRQRERLPEFCRAMSDGLADLVRRISPKITTRDVDELPLLILGSQFQGGRNNVIGKVAVQDVFAAIHGIVKDFVVGEGPGLLKVKNAAGRSVTIALASDPDVRIQEQVGATLLNKVAIEVKGGTDVSNAHNRAGEAEKSHQKAKGQDFREFWTVMAKAGLDMRTLEEESPTTRSWFDVTQVLNREGPDWDRFRSSMASQIGIPLDDIPQ